MDIDPKLLEMLNRTPVTGKVQAVFTLVRPAGETLRSPEDTHAHVQALLNQAQHAMDEAPSRHKVFGHFNSFVLEASPRFVRHLLDGDYGLDTALANHQ